MAKMNYMIIEMTHTSGRTLRQAGQKYPNAPGNTSNMIQDISKNRNRFKSLDISVLNGDDRPMLSTFSQR